MERKERLRAGVEDETEYTRWEEEEEKEEEERKGRRDGGRKRKTERRREGDTWGRRETINARDAISATRASSEGNAVKL